MTRGRSVYLRFNQGVILVRYKPPDLSVQWGYAGGHDETFNMFACFLLFFFFFCNLKLKVKNEGEKTNNSANAELQLRIAITCKFAE